MLKLWNICQSSLIIPMHILPKGCQNVWKIGANSWINQMIWPIPTSKALNLGQKNQCANKKITFQMFVISEFRQNSLPWLAWKARTQKNQRKSPCHCFCGVHTDLEWGLGWVMCPFLAILGLELDPKLVNFLHSLRIWSTSKTTN